MIHDFALSSVCHSCGISLMQSAVTPTCPGKKPAGNTGRHEDSILWDRLRADLSNLGAAYGELPTTSDDYWSCGYCQTAGIRSGDECECGPAMTAQSVPTTLEIVTLGLDGNYVSPATSQRRDSEPVDNLSPTDRNAYFDGIILAARKKREEQYGSLIYDPMSDNGHEWSWNTDACAHCGLTSTEIVENGDEHGDVRCDGGKARNGRLTLSAAMSRPLDFEPRVGHKGVEIDE